jgi:hypothetical protein
MDIVMRFAVKDAVDDAVVRIVHGPVASAVYFAVDDAALRAMREELYS